MGMRAAQDLAVQQPGHLHIRTVDGPTGHLLHTIVPNGARANDFIGCALGHYAFASVVWAASRTARMILS